MLTQTAQKTIGRLGNRGRDGSRLSARTLTRGEVMSVERAEQSVRVVAGQAWLSFDGEDHILEAGEALCLTHGPDRAVISGLGSENLVLKIR